tara:strand:+ start:1688 stop:2062 length:375 start_codon:yes stop_codon:yes gene_type:complete
LNAFSQNDTLKLKDNKKIQLTKPIAKLVIKDLLKGDGLSNEIKTIQILLTETNNKLLSQSDLVFNLKNQIINFERIVNNKDNQVGLSKELSEKLQADLKKQKLKTKLYGGAGILAVVGVLVLIK